MMLLVIMCIFPQIRGSAEEAVETIMIGDDRYRVDESITTILFIGYDSSVDRHRMIASRYRGGGQSDFMMLTVINHTRQEIRCLQLERDTMTDVRVLSVLGKDVGTNRLQLCLAHGYGTSPEDCNERTVDAVSRLLHGIRIDHYAAIDMDGVPRLNDAIGGVDVRIKDDFSKVDPTLVRGKTVHLEGEHALNYLRARQNVGKGKNSERMKRHQVYLEAAVEQFRRSILEDAAYVYKFVKETEDILETDMNSFLLASEAVLIGTYDIRPVEKFAGEYKTGRGGFVEFYLNERSVNAWLKDAFHLSAA